MHTFRRLLFDCWIRSKIPGVCFRSKSIIGVLQRYRWEKTLLRFSNASKRKNSKNVSVVSFLAIEQPNSLYQLICKALMQVSQTETLNCTSAPSCINRMFWRNWRRIKQDWELFSQKVKVDYAIKSGRKHQHNIPAKMFTTKWYWGRLGLMGWFSSAQMCWLLKL